MILSNINTGTNKTNNIQDYYHHSKHIIYTFQANNKLTYSDDIFISINQVIQPSGLLFHQPIK